MFKLYPKLAFQNLKSNYRITVPYLLSGAGIIMMYYMLYALTMGTQQADFYGVTSAGTVLGLGIYVIAIFGAIFLFYTNSFLMKRRKKELGLYNILGMEKRHIAGVILSETIISALICLGLGIALGVAFSKVFFLILEKLLGGMNPVPFVIPAAGIRDAALLFACIFLATALYNILQVRLSKPIELLHGGEVGEKEPKAHWVLAILGFVLLGAGYYLAVTIEDPIMALFLFFVAVVLVVLGTYLLFITGITAMLKLLKKNKGFYYKTKHFTTVSGMLYRMKQNAAGLASICILFTCLLVTVSTTFCLYTGTRDVVETMCPRDLDFSIAANLRKEEIRSFQDQAAQICANHEVEMADVVDRLYWELAGGRQGDTFYINYDYEANTYAVFEVYSLEEYNRISGKENTCQADELLLYDPDNAFDGNTINIFGKDYQVTKIDFPGGLTQNRSYLMGYQQYCLVMNDPDLLQENGQLRIPIYDHPDEPFLANPTFTYNFDLVGHDPETIQAVYKELHNWLFDSYKHWDFYQESSGLSLNARNIVSEQEDLAAMYGGVFFLGLFMGALFLLGTVLIIYYKQVSEGYEDAKRFGIMQKVGMSHREVKESIHSQVLLVFFLPLVTAAIHLCFAFPMLQKILALMQMANFSLILTSVACTVLIFGVVYLAIYLLTARTYYKIVASAN